MTQASFLSSGLSLDDENVDSLINNGIRVLLEQFFDQFKPFQEAADPITALLSASEKQQIVFRERSTEILHASVQSLFRYAIFQKISPISLKKSDSEFYLLSKQFITLLSGIILIYPINKLSIFIDKLLDAFYDIIHDRDFILPNVIEDNIVIHLIDDEIKITTIEIFLQIIIIIISQTANDNKKLLEIIYECLFNFDDIPTIQYLALKCLSRLFPYSLSNSLIQIRLIINFAHSIQNTTNQKRHEVLRLLNLATLEDSYFHNSDKYATLALKNALSSLPNNVIAFLGREILGYLIYLSKYKDFMIINEIFKIIKIYLDADHANCRPLGSLFLNLFESFYQNDFFINLCKKISLFDENFRKQIIYKYIKRKNPEMIPYLMIIYPRLLIEYNDLLDNVYLHQPRRNNFFYENIPISVFFQICAFLAKEKNPDQLGLTKEMIEYLEKNISKGEIPENSLLSPLMRLASDALIPHLPQYDLDTTYNAIFVNRVHIDDVTKDILIKMALSTNPFTLIPYFIIAYKSQISEYNSLFDEFLRKSANPSLNEENPDDFSAYKHKVFIDAIVKVFHDDVEKILPPNIIHTLLSKRMIQSVSFIGYNETTFPLCIKQIFQIFKTDPGPCSEAAFCALKDIPKNVLNTNININKYDFSTELFHIISLKVLNPETPNLSFNLREERFISFIKYLRSKPYPLIMNENFNSANEVQSLSSLLNLFKDSIIPILLRDLDEQSINQLTYLADPSINRITQIDYNSDFFIKARREFIIPSLTEAFTYLLAYCNQNVVSNSLQFLMKLTGTSPFQFVSQFASKLTSNLFLYLGHPKAEIRNNANKGLYVIACAFGKRNKDQSEIIKDSWSKNFQLTIYHFSLIMNGKSIYLMKMVLVSLYNALEQLAPFLHKCYPKLTSLIDLAIKEENLTKKCLSFWIKFLNIVSNSAETIEHLFGHIITQVLPCMDKYPDLVKNILKILIIDRISITRSHFPEIALISDFYERPDLKEFADSLTIETQKINWKDQIKILIDQLEQSSLTFRKQLLNQLLIILKDHVDELANDKLNSDSLSHILVRSLWNHILHETVPELLSLCGRCMSMLPYIQETEEQDTENTSKKDKVDIIITMIKDYLIKILEDSSNSAYHDHAAYTIQELLKKLIKEPSDAVDVKPSLPIKNIKSGEITKTGNLGKIPENIWTVIEPFLNSKFIHNSIEPLISEYVPVITKPNISDINSWLSNWTSTMFSVSLSKKGDSSPDSEIFYCCDCVLSDSPALVKFILPYLISFNSKNKFFLLCIRSEWRKIYEILKMNRAINQQSYKHTLINQNQSFNKIILAKNAMRLFFQLFDVLNKWRIAAGSTHDRGPKWISLNIATDDALADAAFECELYLRALYHLEIHINENNSLTENIQFLYEIYQNIDDSDMKKVISYALLDKNMNDTTSENENLVLDESLSANEISYLSKEQDTNDVISFIQKVLHSGRAERALIDATSLKNKVLLENIRNAKLDAIISSASVKLNRWEEIASISDEYKPIAKQGYYDFSFYLNSKNCSNVDFDSLAEISTGKLLLFLKKKKFDDFTKELNNIRALLSLKLSAVSMMTSYHRLTSILAQFRVFEEVEEFYQKKYCSPESSKKFCFGDWIKQTELSVDDVEFVTSVRCVLISLESATTQKEQDEKSNNLSDQWLNLSKMCRNSESLFRAEMFCSRARHSTTSPERCNYEFAKIAYAKNKKDQALALIKSLQTKILSVIEPSNAKSSTSKLISFAPQTCDSISAGKIEDLHELFGKVIYTRAKWSEEMNSEDSTKIISMYQESVERQEKTIKNQDQMSPTTKKFKNKLEIHRNSIYNAAKAYFSLGALADQRATSFIQYLTELSELGQQKRPRPVKFWNQLSANETKEFLLQMITKALDNYLMCIIYSPSFSYEVVPRILLLFFDIGRHFVPEEDDKKNQSITLSANQKAVVLQAIRDSMLSKIDKVKASVWLNAITQLTSRIEQPKSLEDVLFSLIKMSAIKYPESSLWHLISIKNSTVSSRKPKWEPIMEYIKRDLKKEEQSRFEAIANNFASISHHIIELCTVNPGSSKSRVTKASHICPKLVSDLKDCKVLMPLLSTLTVNIDSSNSQDSPNKIEIIEMGSKIVLFTSLQKPRKVEFKSRNGRSYHYLCKKDEDLRKDMRMMEFATFINRILTNNRQCRQKNLRMVTYAVICLNEYCGMMEWVENTKSFRTIISKMLEFKGIKIDYNEVKKIYIEAEKPTQEQIRQKIYNFENILLKRFPPVLHIWFTSHFKDISSWFNSRLLYTRSTALWSMVGYIIGLGDRHAENILLNTKTGSCVHVDFNLLFDRAKSLTIPEIVPFRLTQNIRDGMGAMGTQGPFTETSILIMDTFRAKKVKLVSVLQPFVNDPLIEWRKVSKAMTESTAKMTLKEVERRITGVTDESKSTMLSSECVVNDLIEKATNVKNLVQMFIGWQSYL